MIEQQRMVEEFHRKFDLRAEPAPMIPDEATRLLRVRLIQEEFDEVKDALARGDLTGIAKELADLLYVIYGTAVSCGIDMDPVFREVHRSNLSKVGGYKRGDGKWVKPPTYSPAQVGPILDSQAERRFPSLSAHVSKTPDAE
jgi:predicted HAD superfamily Cof-like phosphohydrolase